MFGNRFGKDFEVQLEAILATNRPSEAPSKASVIKYANEERSESINYPPPPPKIFNFETQCEREKGRASQADVTPNGVGGLVL